MKKRWKILPIFVLIVFGILALCACQPGKAEEVEGTYELTVFTRSFPDKMPEVEEGQTPPEQTFTSHDYMTEAGVKAYLVIKQDGTGYSVYTDNVTPLRVRTISVTYTKDSDDSTKISMVNYNEGLINTTAVSRATDDIPGYGKESLYVNARSSGVTLTRSEPYYQGILIKRNYSQVVTYTKISGKTDLSVVSEKVNKTLVAPTYELQGLDGKLVVEGLYGDSQED